MYAKAPFMFAEILKNEEQKFIPKIEYQEKSKYNIVLQIVCCVCKADYMIQGCGEKRKWLKQIH